MLPEAPSVVEAGFPQGVFNFWIGLLAPVKTPREIVRKLHDEIAHILLLPDVAERLKRLGAEPLALDPAQFDRYMAEEFQTLGAIMRGAGVKAQ